jgi:hypothetical protein
MDYSEMSGHESKASKPIISDKPILSDKPITSGSSVSDEPLMNEDSGCSDSFKRK